MWYGWSLLIPTDYADPPGDQFQILSQWHHRPRPGTSGPPPVALYLVTYKGQHRLILIGEKSIQAPPRDLGAAPIRFGAWTDLVFHIKWSTGKDGFVEAWINGRPLTQGKKYDPTLYSPLSNYLRLGLYRGKGVHTTNHVFYDEVRIGSSYQAVAP
jgi:hypothetical protein